MTYEEAAKTGVRFHVVPDGASGGMDTYGVQDSYGAWILREETWTIADQLALALNGEPGAVGEVEEMAATILGSEI